MFHSEDMSLEYTSCGSIIILYVNVLPLSSVLRY